LVFWSLARRPAGEPTLFPLVPIPLEVALMLVRFAALFALVLVAPVSMAFGQNLFPDKNLENAVRKQVFEKRNNDMPLTEDDVKNISVVEGVGKGITNLAGLEKCKSLAQVNLGGNEIVDVSPLKDLKRIQWLDLSKNKIVDIAPLAELTEIQYLKLDANQIGDIAALAKMTNLRTLFLSGNQVKDLAPLANCKKVWSVYLENNPAADLKPLAESKSLSTLDVKGCGISDLSPLANLNQLKFLFLERNKIENLNVLLDMAKRDQEGMRRFAPYCEIYLKENPLSDAAKGEQLAELRKLVRKVTIE
jgi:internalin A